MAEPRNIFEQILFGVKATNDNIVAISEDLALVHQKNRCDIQCFISPY